jgi:hypothetical protein
MVPHIRIPMIRVSLSPYPFVPQRRFTVPGEPWPTVPPLSDCLFCRIIAGEVTASIVTETPETVAFLDHRPVFRGHTLVVPRRHVETVRDLPDDLVGTFFTEVRRLSAAVQDGMGADGERRARGGEGRSG